MADNNQGRTKRWTLVHPPSEPTPISRTQARGLADWIAFPTARAPFDVPYGFFGLPPLGSLATAVDVVRRGEVYSFVIPNLDVPPETIVYAPLSGARYVPPMMVAHNVPGVADVVDGYVIKCEFPNGVTVGRQHLRPVPGACLTSELCQW